MILTFTTAPTVPEDAILKAKTIDSVPTVRLLRYVPATKTVVLAREVTDNGRSVWHQVTMIYHDGEWVASHTWLGHRCMDHQDQLREIHLVRTYLREEYPLGFPRGKLKPAKTE